MGEAERKFSQEQYDMLKRCSEAKDMAEWNDWRKKNWDTDVLLEKADLKGFCLEEALLGTGWHEDIWHEDIILEGEVYLQGANLEKANLQGAWFDKANLKGVGLYKAKLQKAEFYEANLQGADLEEANLQGAELRKANLQGANLVGANLQEAKLSYANLQGADLACANLQGAKLRGANLKESRFYEADIQGADFSAAAVDGSTLIWDCEIDEDTDFTGVGLGNIRIDPESRQLLEYNVRRRRWERWYKWKDWFKDRCREKRSFISRFFLGFVRLFWLISDYGSSTKRIIVTFFILSILFASIYANFPFMIDGLEVPLKGSILHRCLMVTVRPVYFSVVTMTTLGFGDIYAEKQSILGHVLLTIQVLLGYILLGALITRFAVLFTAGGPTLSLRDIEKLKNK